MGVYNWVPYALDRDGAINIAFNGTVYCGVYQSFAEYKVKAVIAVYGGEVHVVACCRDTVKHTLFIAFSNGNGATPDMSVQYNSLMYCERSIAFSNFYLENTTALNDVPIYNSLNEALEAMDDGVWDEPAVLYPITYSYSNSVVSGPSEAAVGDTVTVSAVPDVGYGITDASTQILVINNDVAVPYTWDATNQRITFTMPGPS